MKKEEEETTTEREGNVELELGLRQRIRAKELQTVRTEKLE